MAALVVCAFVVLPALSRLNDRLSTSDASPQFRVSKNLERPHEKQVAVPLERAAASIRPDRHLVADTSKAAAVLVDQSNRAPAADRAPPPRV